MKLRINKHIFKPAESVDRSIFRAFLFDRKNKGTLTLLTINPGRAWFSGINMPNILILRVIKLFPTVILFIFKGCIIR